ncbi:MAG: ferritin family protein [Ectothiorhodospiraceae bacterium]|jgi:rubrerythrin
MRNVQEFLAHAVVLEEEAAERYDELADAMEVHNNADVRDLFRRMAEYSRLHLAEAHSRAEAEGGALELKPWEFRWPGGESPEAGDMAQTDYLMSPREALLVALAAERRAFDFYHGVHGGDGHPRVRELARAFAEEEAEHVAELRRWLRHYPAPADGGPEEDMDPPVAAD